MESKIYKLLKLGIKGGCTIALRHSSYPNMLFVRYLGNAGKPRITSCEDPEAAFVYYSVLSPTADTADIGHVSSRCNRNL